MDRRYYFTINDKEDREWTLLLEMEQKYEYKISIKSTDVEMSLGYIDFHKPEKTSLFLTQLYLKNGLLDFRGKWIGTKVLKIIEDLSLKNDIKVICCKVMFDNINSKNWLERKGFRFKTYNKGIGHLGYKKLDDNLNLDEKSFFEKISKL